MAAHAPDDVTLARQHQLRHWSAEALAVTTDKTHFEIVRLLRLPGFCKDSEAFYSGVFGWRIDANNSMGYREIHTGSNAGIQCGIWPAPPQAPALAQLFIQSDDVEATVKRAQELGARVIVQPATLPDGDRMAVLIDPTGLAFAVWKPRE